jgi:methionine aminopeptidase
VRFVDTRRRVVEITRGGYSGQPEQVWYDERTRFDYRGQRVAPEQLEAGDIVRIDARRSGTGWIADTVWVTVDARSR